MLKSKVLPFLLIFLLLPHTSANSTFTSIKTDVTSLQDNRLSDYIIVDFFASGCVPCQISMVDLNEVYETVNGQVNMLSISMDRNETIKDIEKFIELYSGQWFFGWDEDGSLNLTYPVHHIPTTVIMNSNREIIKSWTGVTPANDILRELDNYLTLKGRFLRNPIGVLFDHLFFVIIGIFALVLIIKRKTILKKFNHK